jgi:hypothetical protein
MGLILTLFCFSGLCWGVLLLLWKGRSKRQPQEKRGGSRRSAEIFSLQRERWRRRKSRNHRAASKSR